MNSTTIRLYSLGYANAKTYLAAAIFVGGNIILPQLFHLVPQGGAAWLPIYFFTLVAAYKYGWKAGLLTAILSPLVNSAIFGMPVVAMLPVVMVKSGLLAVAAGLAAAHFKRVSVPILAAVVVAYQLAGTLFEWALTGSFDTAVQHLGVAAPGMILQVFGGYLFIRYLIRN